MWELVKRGLQRERSMAGGQFGRSRRESVQRMHSEIVEAFLKTGRQTKQNDTVTFSSVEKMSSEERRGMREGIWRAVSNLGFAIAMAIRLLNPYVLITAAFGSHRSIFEHLSARVDSMRAVLSPRTGRRRRLTAWIQDTLPQRHIPEAATAVWEDGSLLCGIVETAVSGACPGYDALSHPNTDRSATLWLGQKLVSRYLGVPPVFSDEELLKPFLTVSMERRLLRYLSAVRSAAAQIEIERQKRINANNGSPMALGDDRFSSDCIAQSAIRPEESMLECVARGMGLILGVKGRSSTFYLYLNPNHPHRHVHRLMQSHNLQPGIESVEDEAGAILMQIRGPDGDFGAALISTVPNSTSSSRRYSIGLTESWCGRIPISYNTSEERVQVSFVPLSAGIHELSLLLRGGSHVPGSPFSVTVEEMVQAPVEEEFESGVMWKASSYESGLNKIRPRSGSMDSDPGLHGSWDGSLRQRRRVLSRIVDFVTEKMILTEDGKLERLPKSRRYGERKRREKGLESERGENPTQARKRYFSTTSPTRSRIRQDSSNSYCKTANKMDASPLLAEENISESGKREDIATVKVTSSKKNMDIFRISDAVDPNYARKNPVDFRDHCRRILWLCDILLKHSPRQESLEMLNTAGDILVGKRVHPTIMEESEPEDNLPGPFSGNTALMVQRLHRARSDSNGLNELSKWKEARRSLHTWSRSDRGDSISGGRLLHKDGSYRGIVVRDLNAEAVTGAYAGGDDSKDEGDKLDKEEDEKMKQYLREGRPMPRKPHFSMKRRAAERTSDTSGEATESLEQLTAPDAEKHPSMAEISGKDSNKHVTTKNTEPITYKGSKMEARGLERLGGDAVKGSSTLSGKTEVVPGTESKTTTSVRIKKSNEVSSRKCEIEIKISDVDEEQSNEKHDEASRKETFEEQAKSEVESVDSEIKCMKSEEEIKKPMKKEDSANSEEKASTSEVEEKGKINGRLSREDNLSLLAISSQYPEPPEGTKAEEPSDASGSTSTEFPRVGPRSEDANVTDRPVEKGASERLMQRGKDGEVPKEKSVEVEVKDMGKEETSEELASEDPNLFIEAKECEEEVKAEKKLSEGKRKTISSYTQMISRMLFTDSFPQESLEWFESGEKMEGELEGSIETMEDLNRTRVESTREEEPWGDVETGLGFGLEEEVVMCPDAVGNENLTGGVIAVEGGILSDFTNPQLNQDEEEKNDTPLCKFTETVKRSGVGVGVGVGVVVAGGLFSKEDDSSPERKGDEGPNWWRRDPSRAERMIEMAKQGSTERHWDAISTGIDAMEDGSIARIITGVVGGVKDNGDGAQKLRRWSASEEAMEDMGKKDETEKSPSKYGEERIAGHSITEIPQEQRKGAVGHLQSGRVSKEEAKGAFERRGVVKGPDSVREGGVRKKKDSSMESKGESIPIGEWWSLGDKVESGVGEMEGAWGGKETEAGKLGRHIPEKGIEVKEWEAALGGESAPAERQHHKGIGGKEDLPSVSAGRTDDPLRTGERTGEKRGTTSRGASLKHEKIERAEEAGEALPGAENSKKKAEEKESASRWKDSERKSLKREERVEMEDLEIKEGTGMDEKGKEKGKKPLSTGTEFSSESAESENKYSLAAIKESLRDQGESSGRATKGEVGRGRKLNQVLVKSTKGVVLGSVAEGKCETSFQGAMELGMEKVENLLGCLIDIPKDNGLNEPGSSPKRVGEGIYGIQISLEDWEKDITKESDNIGPETEVIVGECEELDEDAVESSEKGEKSTVIKPSKEVSWEKKSNDAKNWMNEEGETPLLIVDECSGKRQYNFTASDSIRGDVPSINRPNTTEKETDRITRKEESEFPKETNDYIYESESHEKYSRPHRNTSNYPDLEELIGSDFTYKTTTTTAQFNLWPSEEAFGERKVAESLESVLSGKQLPSPMRGVVAGILGNPTHFSRSTIIRSNSPNLMRAFEESTNKEDEKNVEEEEEDIVFVEQEFDDRSDETQITSPRHSEMEDFDMRTHPRAKSGDAFLIFESPGVTTYFPFEMDDTVEKKEGGKDSVEITGDWEEVTIFLDEDDESGDSNKSRIWEVKDEDLEEFQKDPAFVITLDDESSSKNKVPVLPSGRWSNRLSMSPAMSAISEEEAEEAFPDREQRDSSLDTGGEPARWDSYEEETMSETENKDTNPAMEEKVFQNINIQKVKEGMGHKEVPEKKLQEKESTLHQLPVLEIEVEDGFGESFTRRRSSTPSVVSDLGDTPTPAADCGAAFVVTTELAVSLALGVSITQIIPTVVENPPTIPQAEEAADAITMEKTDSLDSASNKKQQARPKERRVMDVENMAKPSSTTNEQQRGWILIDTTKEESIKEEMGEKEDEWRVESVGEVEEAASMTIADGSTTEWRRGYGGAIKKESRAGKAEGKGRGGEKSEFNSGTMDPIRDGMRASRKSGGDNEASSRAKCDGNDAVKEKDLFVRRKIEQGASDGMNITGGDGNDFGAKEFEGRADREAFNAFEGGLIGNSEDAVRREKTILEGRKGSMERTGGNEGERPVISMIGEGMRVDLPKTPRKYPRQESTESEKGKTKEDSQKSDGLMVDQILELTFGERASSNSGGDRRGRRESVFDDYKFDWWEKGFEIKMPKKRSESQDSTGLEYYLDDVEQLLNLELEATEPEVKYISAKEIMENFTKVIESPERVSGSSSSGEWSGTKGGEVPSSDDLVDIASGTQEEKEGTFSKSKCKNNLLEDDLFEGVSKSRNVAPRPRTENSKTIDDLLFGDEISSFEQQSAATEENKVRDGKNPLKDESEIEEKQAEKRNESREKLFQQNRNWEEEHALAKKKREQTKRDKSSERKSPMKLSERPHKNFGIFKTIDKSDESVDLEKDHKKDILRRSRSLVKSLSKEEKETTEVFLPEEGSERRRMIEKENIASTSRDIYPPASTDASRNILDPEEIAQEKVTLSNKEIASLKIEEGERITGWAENTKAPEPSVRDSSKVKDTKSAGSDRIGRIKPAPKEEFVVREAIREDLDLNKTGKSGTQDEVNAREMEKTVENESEGVEIGKGEKSVKGSSIMGLKKSEGTKKGEAEGRKGEKGALENKSGSQSSSIDEYRRAVSEAYAFLDVQESLEGKIEEEPAPRRGLRRESVSWNASVAKTDSWDMLPTHEEWSVISGAETGRMQETTGQEEIDSSESSLSSPLSETRKTTDQTESPASSTKDTSTEESVDERSKQKQRKSKDFDPNDEAVFQTKMTVSSRKDYWDKRLEETKNQSEAVPIPTFKRSSIKHSDIVKKGRISFEQSSSVTENSDSGKSSSESPPQKERRAGRQITSLQRKRESIKTTPTQPADLNRGESDQSVNKASPESSSESEMAKALLNERTAPISEISEMELSQDENPHQQVLVRKDQDLEQKENEIKSTAPKNVEKKRSAIIKNAEKLLLKAYSSDDEKSEKKVPSIRIRGIVSRSKIELEKHSSIPPESGKKAKQMLEDQGMTTADSTEQFTDSSTPSEEGEKTKTKAPSAQKAVSRLTKQFSSTSEEGPTSISATNRPETKTTEISEDTDSEKMISSSSESGFKSLPKRATPGADTLKKEQQKSKYSPKKQVRRPAEVMSEDEGGFVARRKMYWDTMRKMSLDTQRRDSKDDDPSSGKSDLKQVRSMWERRASLDAVPLTEERQRIGRKFFSENMTRGRISVTPLREASAERDSFPVKVSQESTSTKEKQPKSKTLSGKSVPEKKTRVHKSVPSTTPTESQQGKSLAKSFSKSEEKHLPEKTKNDGRERSGKDITPSKAVSSEKSKAETRLSRGESKSPGKETEGSKLLEVKSIGENKVSPDKRSSSEKKTITGDKVAGERIGTTDRVPSEKNGEKVATSSKAPVREKKIKSKKTPSLEMKASAEKKSITDPNRVTNTTKSESQRTTLKENKTEKNTASESNTSQKSKSEKTSSQETQSKATSEPLRSANVLSPQRRESLTPKDAWDSDEERKALEYALSRKRRSSVEIRVTDDEDVCVMREITVVPVFPPKSQMETYEEEEEEGREIHSLPITLESNYMVGRDESPATRRRQSLPPRNLSAQVSGMVANGKQRFENGKSQSKYAASSSEEGTAKGTVKKKKAPLPTLEERLDAKTHSEGIPKVRKSQRSSAVAAGESMQRVNPANTDREYQRAELGEEGLSEKIPATSARGERGDDGRTAISRRAAKGTAPMQKKKPPPSAASSPDSEIDATELPRSFLSAPAAAIRRHSTAVDTMHAELSLLTKRRGSGDLGSPRKSVESKKRFTRARQFFENMEKGKDSPPGEEVEEETPKSKKKKARGTTTDVESGKASVRKSSSKRRSPLCNLAVKDDSESTPDSDKQIIESERLQQRRRSRRGSCDMIHSAPGSDVDNPWETPKAPPRRKKGGEPVLRSQMFGGSERQPRVSERFNVMDLFKDVAGAGTGGGGDLSGRTTPLGIPHQAAVLAALRSVEDVRNTEATSPYDLYRPVEAADDCEPSPAASPDVNANEEGTKEEEDNVKFESSMTLHSKREYQAEYPHLPITSPRRSRHRSSHVDLIPRNVLLKLDKTQSSPMATPSRRSQAELF